MGCYHHNQRAAEIQTQIEEWEKDQTNLIELQSLVATASSNVASYKGFFSSIKAVLDRMIVNGTGFDAENCGRQITSLDGVSSELSTLSGEIAAALPPLKDQIQGAKRTRASLLQTNCNSCQAAINAANSKKNNGSSK